MHPSGSCATGPPLLALAALALAAGCSSSSTRATRRRRRSRPLVRARRPGHVPSRSSNGASASLSEPLQDAAAAPSGSGALRWRAERRRHLDRRLSLRLAATRRRSRVAPRRAPRRRRRQPRRLGLRLRRRQRPEPARRDRQGRPERRCDRRRQAAAARVRRFGRGDRRRGDVVGGYTGSRWLSTILAWRPGTTPRVVARLPVALRYAAVTAAGGKLLIAGGSTPNGTASRIVLAFDPHRRTLKAIAELPAPLTHAAAATLNGIAYVIGGRGATVDSAVGRVSAIDPASGRLRRAGNLAAPRSDLAAVTAPAGSCSPGDAARRGRARRSGNSSPLRASAPSLSRQSRRRTSTQPTLPTT